MRLIKIYSTQSSFRTVEFNPYGPSFILAKQKNPESSTKGKTYNGVGKSLIIRIIHFCLGAGIRDYHNFCDKLENWDFYLDFEIGDQKFTSKRSTNEPKKIMLNDEEISLEKFNKKMKSLCFMIPENIAYLSFRSLLPFFIRPNKRSYVSYFNPGKTGTEYQNLLYNSFLLGLDVSLAQKKQEIRKEQDRIKNLEKNFKKDSLLKDFFTGNKDVSLTLIDLEEQIKKLENDLEHFQVAEDYYDVQKEADLVERELFDLNNNILLIQNNIDNIIESLSFSPDMNKDDIEFIYNESKVYFSDIMKKQLDDLENFYSNLVINRTKRLLEQQNKLMLQKKNKSYESEKLQIQLDSLMKYLGEHQALDLFISLSNKNAELKSERDNLVKYQHLQSEYKTKERQTGKDLIELSEITDKYLNEIKGDTIALRDHFRKLAKIFYPESVAGLTIDTNDGENQLRYDIEAKIELDGSDGINNIKIFCYDLTILLNGYNHKIDFIFHDSRLFDGTDERQKTELFRTVYDYFSTGNKQYIATVNQNQIEEIKKHMEPAEFEEVFTKNVILTLTDDLDSEKLLGIKIDLGEK